MACCGRGAGAGVAYEARSNTGGTKTVATHTEAKLFLAANGGGTIKAVPKKAA